MIERGSLRMLRDSKGSRKSNVSLHRQIQWACAVKNYFRFLYILVPVLISFFYKSLFFQCNIWHYLRRKVSKILSKEVLAFKREGGKGKKSTVSGMVICKRIVVSIFVLLVFLLLLLLLLLLSFVISSVCNSKCCKAYNKIFHSIFKFVTWWIQIYLKATTTPLPLLRIKLQRSNLASVPCQIGEKIMVEVREGRISLPPLVYSARTNFFDRFNLLEAWNEPKFWKVTVVLLC